MSKREDCSNVRRAHSVMLGIILAGSTMPIAATAGTVFTWDPAGGRARWVEALRGAASGAQARLTRSRRGGAHGGAFDRNGGTAMVTRMTLLASALSLMAASVSPAHAYVVYSVINPSADFVFFTYDSPNFITTDTVVPGVHIRLPETDPHRERCLSIHQLALDPSLEVASGMPFVYRVR